MLASMTKPAHLQPSKLGTKEYWDALYTTEIANHAHDPSDTGTAWFDDSDAETKLLEFLGDPERAQELGLDTATTSFLDLGTGNGALLFALRDAGWEGPMLGIDYSPQSVQFARRLERARREDPDDDDTKQRGQGHDEVDIHFAEHDVLHSSATAVLNVTFSPAVTRGWDVLLDKGTFDAISLSTEAPEPVADEEQNRPNEAYGSRILPMIREGGLFLITSCNWVEAELKAWFEDGAVQEIPATRNANTDADHHGEGEDTESIRWGFEAVGRIEYRSFSFGGVKGQTISSLCFRKVRKS
ncbi:hypothetical protein F4861DRAFT_222167 [Xylaria intraflava]|nr:hypothetical protein F4861DRAFT_222167 [Xylaria intraflava]